MFLNSPLILLFSCPLLYINKIKDGIKEEKNFHRGTQKSVGMFAAKQLIHVNRNVSSWWAKPPLLLLDASLIQCQPHAGDQVETARCTDQGFKKW